MTSTSSENSAEPAIDAIDRLLDELAVLSEKPLEPQRFYQDLLDRAVLAVSATAAALWLPGPNEQLVLVSHSQVDRVYPNLNHARFRQDRDRLQSLPRNEGLRPESLELPGRSWLVAVPIKVSEQFLGVLTLYCGCDVSEAALRIHEQFVVALAELAIDFEKNRRVRLHADELKRWQRLNQCALAAYRSLDLRQTAFELVNEGRNFLGCDRVSLFQTSSWSTRLLASSGVAQADPRSELVRKMRTLAQQVERSGEILYYRPGMPSVDKTLRRALDRYVQESSANEIIVVPLQFAERAAHQQTAAAGRRVGVLIVESLGKESPPLRVEYSQWIAAHATNALARAQQYQSIPLLPMWLFLGRLFSYFGIRRLARTLIVLAILAAMIVPLFVVETDFIIEARGELRPVMERHVFAPADGIVNELNVGHGIHVEQGDVIAKLRSPELDRELETVIGEQQIVTNKIETLTLAISQTDPSSPDASLIQSQFAAQISELEQKLENLLLQEKRLLDERAELEVRAPITGQILTWQVRQLLQSRPVRRGEALLQIADIDRQWHLELEVPDRKIGYVIDADREQSESLTAQFVLETDPDQVHSAKLERIAQVAVNPANEQAHVRVNASFDREDVAQLRPGAGVIAKINCGRRKLGYVWLHDMIDSIQRRFFW